MRAEILTCVPVFESLPPSEVDLLAETLLVRDLEASSLLFRGGESEFAIPRMMDRMKAPV